MELRGIVIKDFDVSNDRRAKGATRHTAAYKYELSPSVFPIIHKGDTRMSDRFNYSTQFFYYRRWVPFDFVFNYRT